MKKGQMNKSDKFRILNLTHSLTSCQGYMKNWHRVNNWMCVILSYSIHINTLLFTITTLLFMVMFHGHAKATTTKNTDTSCINTVHMLCMHTAKTYWFGYTLWCYLILILKILVRTYVAKCTVWQITHTTTDIWYTAYEVNLHVLFIISLNFLLPHDPQFLQCVNTQQWFYAPIETNKLTSSGAQAHSQIDFHVL